MLTNDVVSFEQSGPELLALLELMISHQRLYTGKKEMVWKEIKKHNIQNSCFNIYITNTD